MRCPVSPVACSGPSRPNGPFHVMLVHELENGNSSAPPAAPARTRSDVTTTAAAANRLSRTFQRNSRRALQQVSCLASIFKGHNPPRPATSPSPPCQSPFSAAFQTHGLMRPFLGLSYCVVPLPLKQSWQFLIFSVLLTTAQKASGIEQ